MQIKTFVQGKKPAQDRELFAAVGALALHPDVHKALGTAISSTEGDIWAVALGDDGACLGFAQGRDYATGMHLRYAYAAQAAVRKQLAKAMIAIAQESDERVIYINERPSDKLWSQLGFTFTPRARGEFGRWEKPLKETKK